jgi:hypothetical protein
VADAALGHEEHEILDGVVWVPGVHLGGHDLGAGRVEQVGPGLEAPGDVAFGDDAGDGGPVRRHDQGAEVVPGERGHQAAHRVLGSDGDDAGAFGSKDVADALRTLPFAQ